MRNIPTVAISSEDHKLAALLFDYLVPVHSSAAVPDEVKFQHPELAAFGKRSVDEELADTMRRAKRIVQEKPESWVQKIITEVPSEQVAGFRSSGFTDREIAALETFIHYVRNLHTAQIHSMLTANGVRSAPLFRSTVGYETYLLPGSTEAVEISLIKAPLIDTSNLEWDDILVIRRDKDFTRRLRNFRLFLNENYRGKEVGYVLDDLNKKLEEYETSCRKSGLSLTLTTLHQTLSSKSLLGSLGIAAIGVLTGNPTAGLAAGVAVEIGKLAISVGLRRLELSEGIAWSELAYLAEIASRVEDTTSRK